MRSGRDEAPAGATIAARRASGHTACDHRDVLIADRSHHHDAPTGGLMVIVDSELEVRRRVKTIQDALRLTRRSGARRPTLLRCIVARSRRALGPLHQHLQIATQVDLLEDRMQESRGSREDDDDRGAEPRSPSPRFNSPSWLTRAPPPFTGWYHRERPTSLESERSLSPKSVARALVKKARVAGGTRIAHEDPARIGSSIRWGGVR